MKELFTFFLPDFVRNLDSKWLLNNPILWASRIHEFLYFAILILVLSIVGVLVVPVRYSFVAFDLENVIFFGALVNSGLILIWLATQSLLKIRQNHGVANGKHELKIVLIFLLILGFGLMNVFIPQTIYRHRVKKKFLEPRIENNVILANCTVYSRKHFASIVEILDKNKDDKRNRLAVIGLNSYMKRLYNNDSVVITEPSLENNYQIDIKSFNNGKQLRKESILFYLDNQFSSVVELKHHDVDLIVHETPALHIIEGDSIHTSISTFEIDNTYLDKKLIQSYLFQRAYKANEEPQQKSVAEPAPNYRSGIDWLIKLDSMEGEFEKLRFQLDSLLTNQNKYKTEVLRQFAALYRVKDDLEEGILKYQNLDSLSKKFNVNIGNNNTNVRLYRGGASSIDQIINPKFDITTRFSSFLLFGVIAGYYFFLFVQISNFFGSWNLAFSIFAVLILLFLIKPDILDVDRYLDSTSFSAQPVYDDSSPLVVIVRNPYFLYFVFLVLIIATQKYIFRKVEVFTFWPIQIISLAIPAVLIALYYYTPLGFSFIDLNSSKSSIHNFYEPKISVSIDLLISAFLTAFFFIVLLTHFSKALYSYYSKPK